MPSFTYTVTNRQALDLLEQIVGFLRSYKKERAKLVLENYIRLTPRNGKYNKDLINKRTQFIETFFELTPK